MSRFITIQQNVARRFFANPDGQHSYRAGVSRLPDRTDWLIHDRLRNNRNAPQVQICAFDGDHEFQRTGNSFFRRQGKSDAAGIVAIGTGEHAGRIAAISRVPGGTMECVDVVRFTTPGLPHVAITNKTNSDSHLSQPQQPVADAIWSRTIGALGRRTWTHLANLNVVLIGCGRTGSRIANSLRRGGIATAGGAGSLTLIDPDVVELHVGEMSGVDLRDVGRRKVDAVADSFTRQKLSHRTTTRMLYESVSSFSALLAIKRSDVVLSMVDSSEARLLTSIYCSMYLRPLIDLGVGIFSARHLRDLDIVRPQHQLARVRQMGADVRLTLPGSCLCCYGGVGQIDERPTMDTSDWRSDQPWQIQRAGSLASLNQIGVGMAQRLLEDLVGNRIRESTWLHLDFSQEGIPTIDHRRVTPRACPVCEMTGAGDEAVHRIHEVMGSV